MQLKVIIKPLNKQEMKGLLRNMENKCKALIDTNVMIDCPDERVPHVEQDEKILTMSEKKKLHGIFTASSATDIYYVLRKKLGRDKTIISKYIADDIRYFPGG